MCMPLVVITIKKIKPLPFCRSVLALIPQSPFTETTRYITSFFEDFSHGDIFREKWDSSGIPANRGVSLVIAGHQGTSRGCANGVSGVTIGKADTLLRHTINIGSANRLTSITTEIMVTHVIDHNKNDIGLRRTKQLPSYLQY